MPDFMPEPLKILPDKQALLDALQDDTWWKPGLTMDKFNVRPEWLCELIVRMKQEKNRSFVYNSEVMAQARIELDLPPVKHEEGTSPLSTLVYNAQTYVYSDQLRAQGFVPLTQEVIDEAHRKRYKIEVNGIASRTKALEDGRIVVYKPRTRARYHSVDGRPVKLLKDEVQ